MITGISSTINQFLDNLRDARGKGSPDRRSQNPQLKESVLQIPYNGLESFLQVERVLRRAIGSQAENVGLHVRFLNEEHCEFGSA